MNAHCNMHTVRNQLTFSWISGQSVHIQSRLRIHLAVRFPKEFIVSSFHLSASFLPSSLLSPSFFLSLFTFGLWVFLPFDKNVIVNTYRGTVVDILVSFPSIEVISRFDLVHISLHNSYSHVSRIHTRTHTRTISLS